MILLNKTDDGGFFKPVSDLAFIANIEQVAIDVVFVDKILIDLFDLRWGQFAVGKFMEMNDLIFVFR